MKSKDFSKSIKNKIIKKKTHGSSDEFVCAIMSKIERAVSPIYYIHFEITGYSCNLTGPQQCDLFPNRTIFCSKSHLFLSQ